MKKLALLALAVCLFSTNIYADPVTKGEARRIAEKWLEKKTANGAHACVKTSRTSKYTSATDRRRSPTADCLKWS